MEIASRQDPNQKTVLQPNRSEAHPSELAKKFCELEGLPEIRPVQKVSFPQREKRAAINRKSSIFEKMVQGCLRQGQSQAYGL